MAFAESLQTEWASAATVESEEVWFVRNGFTRRILAVW